MAKILRVYLQARGGRLQSVSEAVISVARELGEGNLTQGVVFLSELTEDLREKLEKSGLSEILIYEGAEGFLPELQGDCLESLETPEIFLFPGTPEGRAMSSLMGARLHTGVTADCTALSFTESGRLLQTRPAFSGSRLASILTEKGPQLASLRFSLPVSAPQGKTRLILQKIQGKSPYPVCWLDRPGSEREKAEVLLAIGGGIQKKEDIPLFEALAEKLGGNLYCSRCLVDRGWMEKRRQIGLSGSRVSAKRMITLGISGSIQFCEGLGDIDHLCTVDLNPDTPLMAMADTPIQGDLYEIAHALLKM